MGWGHQGDLRLYATLCNLAGASYSDIYYGIQYMLSINLSKLTSLCLLMIVQSVLRREATVRLWRMLLGFWMDIVSILLPPKRFENGTLGHIFLVINHKYGINLQACCTNVLWASVVIIVNTFSLWHHQPLNQSLQDSNHQGLQNVGGDCYPKETWRRRGLHQHHFQIDPPGWRIKAPFCFISSFLSQLQDQQ